MKHIHRTKKFIITATLAASLAIGQFAVPLMPLAANENEASSGSEVTAEQNNPSSPDTDNDDNMVIDPSDVYSEELLKYIPKVVNYIPYLTYLEQHSSAAMADEAIDVDLATAEAEDMDDFTYADDVISTGGSGELRLTFTAPSAAFYELEIEYYPASGSGTAIERSIALDGEVPFDEADRILLARTYKDENKDYQSVEGNQSFPSQVEAPRWTTQRIKDQNGYFLEPLKFYLAEGEHTLTIASVKEPMDIRAVRFVPAVQIPAYEDYLKQHTDAGAEVIGESSAEPVQGEDADFKSSPSLYPLNDRTSPLTQPYHPTYVRMNTIGGASWDGPGEWLEWQAEVPEAGLYRVAFRFRQDLNTGSFSTRQLYVNGEIPFEEATHITFDYNSAWQVQELTDSEGEPLLVYLDEGINTLRLEVSLDVFADLIYEVEDIAVELNGIAQDIVVITSTAPDPYRDYQLTQRLPHMLPTMTEQQARLKQVIADLVEAMGGSSDKTAALDKAALQLGDMLKDPRTIAANLPSLQSNITSLGNWALNIKSQSLTLDYIALLGENDPLPKARANIFQNMLHEIRAFIGSFTNDFGQVTAGAADEQDDTITVWVTTGRDQMDVIRRLLNETFQEDVAVELRLVASAVALSATAAGRGPDVLIQTDSAQPIDFAFREAAYDLTQFDDFDEVASWVHPAALNTFEFNGGYYALPDQMSFPVLFYRSDILSELQIPVPQTWEDIITIVPFLQNNNMEFFMEVSTAPTLGAATQSTTKAINSVYLSMLYQAGGEIYNEPGTLALTDSPESLQVFSKWTDYYTKHSFPVTLDFVTRFRLGSVPLAIVNFTNYTTLSVSAPEIRGDWAIAPIPGTRQEDGTINRSLPAVTSAGMIIRPMVEANDNAEAAWSFLKWWVSAETQTNYAAEMESLLGSSARYPVANLEAFSRSPWPSQAMEVLTGSLADLREVRQVPGSYITGRNVENAFYEVVNEPEDSNVRRSMVEWTENTNYEITSKREEFGLPVYEEVE